MQPTIATVEIIVHNLLLLCLHGLQHAFECAYFCYVYSSADLFLFLSPPQNPDVNHEAFAATKARFWSDAEVPALRLGDQTATAGATEEPNGDSSNSPAPQLWSPVPKPPNGNQKHEI
jgi:hypothetical protein